jgi:ADP-heptose:LPS heptosyltransferase
VPVVALLETIHPRDRFEEWGPWNNANSIVSKDLECVNCHSSDRKTFECAMQITSEDILEVVKEAVAVSATAGDAS